MLFAAMAVKLVMEIALLSLLGQWLLGILAGQRRDQNIFYQLLTVMTRPFTRLVRLITPGVVIDRHIPMATFVLLGMVWIGATLTKISICVQLPAGACL